MAIESYKNAKVILINDSISDLYETPTNKSAVVHAVLFC